MPTDNTEDLRRAALAAFSEATRRVVSGAASDAELAEIVRCVAARDPLRGGLIPAIALLAELKPEGLERIAAAVRAEIGPTSVAGEGAPSGTRGLH